MATSIFLGYPPPYIEQWYKNPHPTPVLTGATWFSYYDGTSQSAYIENFTNQQIPGDKGALTSISFGEACTGIGPYSFDGCTSLTSLDVNRSDIGIYEHALEDSSIQSIIVEGNGQFISENAFICDYLQEITVDARTVDEMLFNNLAEIWGIGEAADGTLYPVTVNCLDGSFVVNEREEDSSQGSGSGSSDFDPYRFYVRAYPNSDMANAFGSYNWVSPSYAPTSLDICYSELTSRYNLTPEQVQNGTNGIVLPVSLTSIESDEIHFYFAFVHDIMINGRYIVGMPRKIFNLDTLTQLFVPDITVQEVIENASSWGLGFSYDQQYSRYVDVWCSDGYIQIFNGSPVA